MIRAVYEVDRCRVQVQGHAGFAPMGQDTVCAAASALLYTLAEAVKELERMGMLEGYRVELQSGAGEVCWTPSVLWRSYVMTAMNSICLGFRLLARDYGEYVGFEVRRTRHENLL